MNGASPKQERLTLEALQARLGQEIASTILVDPIAPRDVRRYANAVEDFNPLWHDDVAARAAGYDGPLAPPCLLLEFMRSPLGADHVDHRGITIRPGAGPWGIPFEMPFPYVNPRRGQDEIFWHHPARLGDHITVSQRLSAAEEKTGHVGRFLTVTIDREYRNQENTLLLVHRQTIVWLPDDASRSPLRRRLPSVRRPLSGRTASAPARAAEIAPGDLLPPLHFGPLTIIHTVRWAAFTENWYRVHFDREYAASEGEGAIIASGGFRLALIARMLTDWLGTNGQLRRLLVRQAWPTHEGEVLTIAGQVEQCKATAAGTTVTCRVWGCDGEHREVLQGTAVVELTGPRS